jgi:two-component system, NtrC family, response regulator HydG
MLAVETCAIGSMHDDSTPSAQSGLVALANSEEHLLLIRGTARPDAKRLAHAIHQASPRRSLPFRCLPCRGMPGLFIESELFGHLPDAFPGALRERPGLLELAAHGTLLLEDLDGLPAAAAARLDRALSSRRGGRLGSRNHDYPVTVRVIGTIARVPGRSEGSLAALCAQFRFVPAV